MISDDVVVGVVALCDRPPLDCEALALVVVAFRSDALRSSIADDSAAAEEEVV